MPLHPRERDLLQYRYGTPARLSPLGAGHALRCLGRRAVTHPHDVIGYAFGSVPAAVAWLCAYRTRWGYPVLGIITGGDGISAAGLLDLGPSLDMASIARTDPNLPDTYQRPPREGP